MRIAYADPPYIGMANKHYSHDPQCAEVDHEELIDKLCGYDAWALSMSACMRSFKAVVPIAPEDVRWAAWVKPFASFKPGTDPAYTWEPLLFRTKRTTAKNLDTIRDHISCPITIKKGLVGAKPEAFCYWLFELLGALPEDEFHDLYPGTGVVTRCWDRWCEMKSNAAFQLELINYAYP